MLWMVYLPCSMKVSLLPASLRKRHSWKRACHVLEVCKASDDRHMQCSRVHTFGSVSANASITKSFAGMAPRDKEVYFAKLAEQAERYDEMAEHMPLGQHWEYSSEHFRIGHWVCISGRMLATRAVNFP